MLDSISNFLDWFGIVVFAISGALVASRKQMDIVGFALLGCVTGVGGGTLRDLFLGSFPIFWIGQPNYLLTCVAVSCAAFFLVQFLHSRVWLLLWCDAVGLSLFSVTGAEIAQRHTASSTIIIAMGIATATMGGIIRDVLGQEIPVILRREIYATAALLGASVFVLGERMGMSQDKSLIAGFSAAFLLRAAAIHFDLSLPVFGRAR